MTSKKRPDPCIGRAVVHALEPRRLLSLATPVSYTVGTSPQGVASGDFNGDGRSDVVTGNVWSDNVTVRLSNPDGTLGAAQQFATGPSPVSVAVGDVNNDGKADIITANGAGSFSSPGSLSVLLGNGNGAFQPALSVVLPAQFPPGYNGAEPLGQQPISVAVGDFNADGELDLAVSARTTKQVLYCGYYGCGYFPVADYYTNVLLGHGDGTFDAANSYLTGSTSVGLADFNSDGKLDVVTTVGLMLGNGDGTLDAPDRGFNFVAGSVIGDFDNDGKFDFVRRGGSGLEVIKGHGDGTFSVANTFAVLPTSSPDGLPVLAEIRSMVAGDVNGDGKLDLVVNTQVTRYASCPWYCYDPSTTEETRVLLGFGDNTFSLPIVSTLRTYPGRGSAANSVALGDVNNDGRPDVIATEPTLNMVSVQLNQGGWVAPVAVEIGDATVTEGHSGTVNALVTVTLDHAVAFAVSVPFSTADGSATVAGGDYFADSGTLNFSPGQTSKTITVQVRGDRRGEEQETFFVNLGDPANAFATDAQGIVTILEDEPILSLDSSAQVTEGDGGTKPLIVTATLSVPYDVPVTFDFVPQGGSNFATAGVDFDAAPGTVTFQPGQTSRPITVTVRGDTLPEYVESVSVAPSNVTNALWDGSVGHGLIVDDDAGAAVVIANVSRAEGNSGTTPFTFTLTRLTPSEREQFVYFSTSGGSASSGGGNQDYNPVSSGAAHFSPGQVNTTLTVFVRGDTRSESDETFLVNLTSTTDGTIADSQAVGTILNDETRGKTWVGPDFGGNWATASNWSPSGVPTATSLVTIRNASVTLSSSATVAELSLGGGSARLTVAPSGNRVLRTGALFIENGSGSDVGILDLTDNDLIVDYAAGAGNVSPLGAWNRTGFGIGGTGAPGWYDGMLGSLARGYNDGNWTGAGIVTTRPDALSGRTTLAVGEASQTLGLSGAQTASFAGQTVDATTVLVKYTYAGDATLNGIINGDDYFAIDSGYASGQLGYVNGDFDYNVRIDADDYFLIDSNYSKSQTLSATTPRGAAESPASIVSGASSRSAYEHLMESQNEW